MKEAEFSLETKAYIHRAIEEDRQREMRKMAQDDLEFEARLKALLSAPPLELDLYHAYDFLWRYPRGPQFLHHLLNHPEIPYDMAMELAKRSTDDRAVLEQNPTVQLYRLEGKWARELAEWEREREEYALAQEVFLQTELAVKMYQLGVVTQQDVRELLGVPPPNTDESSTPVMSALTSLPDPLKK